ncbi:MAG: T9SS type A sorting domain-containing protein [Saprospiraceae bacterium]|nr:T9SS type A sorting domain-containing protein [Saprospiraceae bacterium]
MRSIFTNLSLVILACVFAQPSGYAQGWERTFGFDDADALSDVLPTADGGYITVGYTQVPNQFDRQVYLIKTDADGIAQWTSSFGDDGHSEFPKHIVHDGSGGYVIGGTSLNDGINRAFLARADAFGNMLWLTRTAQDSIQGWKVLRLNDGNYALVGSQLLPSSPGAPNSEVFLMKADANGNILWTNTYGGGAFDEGRSLVETPAGDLILAGHTTSFGAGNYDVYLVGTTASGVQVWTKTLGTPGAEFCHAISPTADGNYVLTGRQDLGSSTGQDAYLAKINPIGDSLWWRTYEWQGVQNANALQELPTGGFVLAGDVQATINGERQVLMVRVAPNGDYQGQQQFGGVMGDGGNAVRSASGNGFVIAGFTNSFGAGGSDGYLIRTDSTGISLSSYIRGNVHSNLNNSCVPDNFGLYVPDYMVEIAGTRTYYGTTDSLGNYLVPVETGSYEVRLLNPSPIWEACQDSVDVNLVGVFDTATVDFSIHSTVQCPAMEVDLSTLNLRRCFQNTYTVKYRNLGSQNAYTAAVQVEFDPWLTVDSTSIPWIAQTGNLYVFDVGNIPPFGQGKFQAWVTVDCDSTVLGQTHCSEAHIFPDSICLVPDPIWDGSSVEVNATCDGDSVHFNIHNYGIDDMSTPLGFIVVEDQILQMQGEFLLELFEDTLITLPSNGATYRLEAQQSPGHPGRSRPSVSVEGCGGTPFSTGFVVDYPLNDADLFMDTDCRENVGSFDPNDKQGFPNGYGDEHFIAPGTDIEYLIRFQNTGTDTAFTVVIRDTLSQFLDPRNVEPGASSHPYRMEVYGLGILKFRFDNIMLPDSNVNEPASHGYVKFRVKQRSNIALGSVIENRAGIYFDFNEPIITNTTYHTIGENFIVLSPVIEGGTGSGPVPFVRISPNPFSETALFELENVLHNHLIFILFDHNGRRVRQVDFENKRFQFQRDGLPSGVYFFQIASPGGTVANGKVVLR